MQATESAALAISKALADTDASVAYAADHVIEISSPSARSGRRIQVRVRDSSDFDVAFFVSGAPGSPFEQVFVGPGDESSAVLAEVAGFVRDLVTERIALVIDPRWFGRGRRFVPAAELGEHPAGPRRIVVSWRGTHDANPPPG